MRDELSPSPPDSHCPDRGIEVDHVTLFGRVQRFTPLLADAARPCRRAVGDRWFVDETYVKVAGKWRDVYGPSRLGPIGRRRYAPRSTS